MSGDRVLIAGASLAGLRTAQALRRTGFSGSITMVGKELHAPYDRPPLSKEVLTKDVSASQVILCSTDDLRGQGIDLITGVEITDVDLSDRTVTCSDGNSRGFTELVAATGARPHQPFADAPRTGVFTLRTLQDALSLRSALAKAHNVVIIGAGFIGLEIASAARSLGGHVTVLEAAPAPLARSLPTAVARAVTSLATRSGVDVRCDAKVIGFTRQVDELRGVCLADGTVLAADVAVVGVGVQPCVGWLEAAGAPVDRMGLLCDATGRALEHQHLWGVGDACAWLGADGIARRHEHWTTIGDQAKVVAQNLTHRSRRQLTSAPYAWSDQFGHKIHIIGEANDADEVRILSREPTTLTAMFARQGHLTGACIVDQAPLALKLRRWIASSTPVCDIPPWQHSAA